VPRSFRAVGSWYADFSQVTDDDVTALLGDPSNRRAVASTRQDAPPSPGT
jgi:predicted phosphoribosyltransferase